MKGSSCLGHGLLRFDAAGFRVDVNFAEVKRVWFGEEARRNSVIDGRADFEGKKETLRYSSVRSTVVVRHSTKDGQIDTLTDA